MKLPLKEFFRQKIIAAVPAGLTADRTAALGLMGLMQNANNYSQEMASYATASAGVTILPANLVDGIIQLNAGAGAGYAVTLPTTSQILGALTGTVPQDGSFTKIVRIVNNGSGQTATLTAGDAPTSIIGTATIANNACRDYAMRVLASAITFSNLGALTL